MVKVKIEQDVYFCSLCPFGKVTGPEWDRATESEVYAVKCEKQNGKIVHECLSWYECAGCCNNDVDCYDYPPSSCPFQPIDNQQ